jgi:hypothetical protein
MANEWVLVHETQLPIPFTVADNVSVEKGTLCKMTDPRTAAASDGNNDIFAGVTAEEKIASDGRTKLGLYRGGIFKVKASGAITVGDPLVTKGSANLVITAAVNQEQVIGIALETAAEAETFLVELRPTVMQLA